MPVEVAADHLAVIRPRIERVCGTVKSREPASVANEVEQCRPLVCAQRKLAAGKEKHCIEAAEVFGRNLTQVFCRNNAEDIRARTDILQTLNGEGQAVMPISRRRRHVEYAMRSGEDR